MDISHLPLGLGKSIERSHDFLLGGVGYLHMCSILNKFLLLRTKMSQRRTETLQGNLELSGTTDDDGQR